MSAKQDELIPFPGPVHASPVAVVEQGRQDGVVVPGYFLVPPDEQMTTEQVDSLHKTEKELWKWNVAMAVLHGVQAVAVLGAGLGVARLKNFQIPLTTTFTDWGGNGFPKPAIQNVTTVPFVPLVSIFAFLSCLFHVLVLVFYPRYLADLRKGMNRFRWVEYSLSSSFMIVFIAQLFGVYSVTELTAVFICNMAMNQFGDSFEVTNAYMRYAGLGQIGGRIDWSNFIYGCIAGLAPWAVIASYIGGGGSASEVPGFVWAALIIYALFFASFPVNMILQYLAIPKKWFADKAFPGSGYYQGEKGYQILSLVAKSLLLWLVVGGANQPNSNVGQ